LSILICFKTGIETLILLNYIKLKLKKRMVGFEFIGDRLRIFPVNILTIHLATTYIRVIPC